VAWLVHSSPVRRQYRQSTVRFLPGPFRAFGRSVSGRALQLKAIAPGGDHRPNYYTKKRAVVLRGRRGLLQHSTVLEHPNGHGETKNCASLAVAPVNPRLARRRGSAMMAGPRSASGGDGRPSAARGSEKVWPWFTQMAVTTASRMTWWQDLSVLNRPSRHGGRRP